MRKKCKVKPSTSPLKYLNNLYTIVVFFILAGPVKLNANPDSVLHKIIISVEKPEILKLPFALGSFYKSKFENVSVKGNIKANTLLINFYPPREGLYKLRFGKNIETDFIISRFEETTRINLLIKDSLYEFNIEGAENEAYQKLNEIMTNRLQSVTEANLLRERISEVNPQYYFLKQQYKEAVDSVKETYNLQLDSIAKIYSGSYTANVLVPLLLIHTRYANPQLYKIYDNHHAYYHRHYFDGMPLTDNRVLNHPAFVTQLAYYLANYLGEYDEDFERATNYMLNLKATAEVNEFMRLNLLSSLYKDEKINAVSYVINNYMEGCSASDDLKKLIDAILNNPVRLNAPLPQARLFGYNNLDTFYIPGIFQSTPNYVVIFWRKDCTHCLETLASLKNKRTDSSWRIVTVLLNTEPKPEFDESLLSTRWFNLQCGSELEKVLTAYKIVKTPAIYYINSSRNVIKYANSISDIPIVYRTEK